MQHITTNKTNMALIIFIIIMVLCSISFVCCCCLSIVTGGISDWYMSECLAVNTATNEQKTACYGHETEATCDLDEHCWWRHSIITMMLDSIGLNDD
tara:strand:- start:739 stop:1029 length:291 start_codon:yes stop_codon:yes gene_type:complete